MTAVVRRRTEGSVRRGALPAVATLFVLALLAANDDRNPNATLLFKSGFESDTWIEAVSGAAYNQWPRIHGTDYSTGLSWNMPLFSAGPFTLLQTLTSSNRNPAPGSPADYIQNTIETVIGPYGTPTKALKMHLLRPSPNTCCIQDTFVITGMTPIRDIYFAHWMKFNPEMLSQLQAQGTTYWRMLFEMKTATDYRIQANIQSNGSPYFAVHADNGGLSGPPRIVWYWQEKNTTVPVPLDQWFYMEFYLHRAADNTGRFFWAVNGQIIVDRSGATYGANTEEIAALMFTNLYGPNPANWYQWLDDFEVWDLPPCIDLPCRLAGAPADNSGQSERITSPPAQRPSRGPLPLRLDENSVRRHR